MCSGLNVKLVNTPTIHVNLHGQSFLSSFLQKYINNLFVDRYSIIVIYTSKQKISRSNFVLVNTYENLNRVRTQYGIPGKGWKSTLSFQGHE